MVALVQPTVAAIMEHYERSAGPRHRSYLGASEIGEPCPRRLWYSLRNASDGEAIEGRVYRLFETGHREEARLIENLRAIGCTVWDRDPATGQQFRYTALDGHLSCGLDGVVLGVPEAPQTPHLLECKSSNRKNFAALQKDGVEKAKPVHFAQMQMCMGLADLTRALYLVVCKDDDSIYAERVNFNAAVFKALMEKAAFVVRSESPPDKISSNAGVPPCLFCPFRALCQGPQHAMPRTNCRTCVHAAPGSGGAWACANNKPEVAAGMGCDEHILIPGLLEGWATPIDGDPTWVRYRAQDGSEFANVAASGFPAIDVPHLSSAEISQGAAVRREPAVAAAVSTLGARVESATEAGWVKEP